MGDRIVAVPGHLRQQAVAIHQDPGRPGLFYDLIREGRMQPDSAAYAFDPVKIEKDIRFPVVMDIVFIEQGPFPEVFIPIAKFHIEAAVDSPVVHLPVEAFPVRHGALPFFPARLNAHSPISFFFLLFLFRPAIDSAAVVKI
jgi:hypothetical protein